MPAALKVDWEAIRVARRTQSKTYDQLSAEFGVKRATIVARAVREGWMLQERAISRAVNRCLPKEKEAQRIRTQVADSTAEKLVDFVKKSVDQATGIMDAGATLVAQALGVGDARAARDAAACWSMGHTGARTALGLDRPGGSEPTEWAPVGQLLPSPAPVVDVEEVGRPPGPTPE